MFIVPGTVDNRDINKVHASELRSYDQVHLFAGIGLWSRALRLAGWPDTQSVWTLSCPCQPFSIAGKHGAESDIRHLWPVARRLVKECKPATLFGEQVASPLGRDWFARVRVDLEALGYAVGCADLCAAGVGAPHIRQRLWFGATRLAHTHGAGPSQREGVCCDVEQERAPTQRRCRGYSWESNSTTITGPDQNRRRIKSGIELLADGHPLRVARLRAIGNGIVPELAAAFIQAFSDATQTSLTK